MTPKTKRRLRITAATIAAAFALLAAYIYVIGRDIAPADFSDLALPVEEPILPEDNAYTYFKKAADALIDSYTDENGESISLGRYLRENRTNSAIVAKVFSENQEALNYLQQGCQCLYYVLPNPLSFTEHISIQTLLRAKARLAQEINDFDGAIQDAGTLFRHAQLVLDSPSPTIILLLVGYALENIALNEIQRLARNDSLSTEQLNHLLALVSAIPSRTTTVQNALKGEFQFMSTQIEKMATEKIKLEDIEYVFFHSSKSDRNSIPFPVFKYMFLPHQTQLDIANLHRMIIPAISKFYAEMNHETLNKTDISDRPIWRHRLGLYFCRNYLGRVANDISIKNAVDSLLENRCKMDANLAATQIIIACHLFQRETGRKPQTLGELVPAYLPAVPLDPFDGKPFRYNPDAGTVYSVGKRLEDLGGIPDPTTPPDDFSQIWRAPNAIFKIWE